MYDTEHKQVGFATISDKLPAMGAVVLGAAYRGTDGIALCSTKPLSSANDAKWREELQLTRSVRQLQVPRPGARVAPLRP